MTRTELVIAMAIGCGMIVVALVLLFGLYALLGSGVVMLVGATAADPLDFKKPIKVPPNGRE